MLQSLEKQEETTVEIKETFNSLQQEVEVKTKKLKKVGLALDEMFELSI